MNATSEKTVPSQHDAIAQLAWRHWQKMPGQPEIKQTIFTSKNVPVSRDHLAIRLATLARLGAAHP